MQRHVQSITGLLLVIALFITGVAFGAEQAPQADHTTAPPQAEKAGAPAKPTEQGVFEPWSGRYRLTPGDVIVVGFPYIPEFDQQLSVQPDGYVTLRAAGEVRAQSHTLAELRQKLQEAYAPILRDPVITVALKEFEKPYFIASGEVKQPGKFDLRGATTVTQALAQAGGIARSAKHSQVLLFRNYSEDLIEVKELNVEKMIEARDLSEDPLLRPGDTIFVPRNLMSYIVPWIPKPSFGIGFRID